MTKYLFDELPTDMIYYEIFPYLDYNSRVTANTLLPPQDRLRTPLRKGAVLEFSVTFSCCILISNIKKQVFARNKITRNRFTLKIWRIMLLLPDLVQHSAKLRATFINKALEFSSQDSECFQYISRYMCKTLRVLSQKFLLYTETSYPFLHEVIESSRIQNWSALTE
jgi:hypothetical protein